MHIRAKQDVEGCDNYSMQEGEAGQVRRGQKLSKVKKKKGSEKRLSIGERTKEKSGMQKRSSRGKDVVSFPARGGWCGRG